MKLNLKRTISIGLAVGTVAISVSPLAYANETYTPPTSQVNSITLEAGTEPGQMEWSVDGTLRNGVKVVWSENEQPTYPKRDGEDNYHYLSSNSASSDVVTPFTGEGTYYVRVCEYLGNGSCGTYSNQLEVELSKDGSETPVEGSVESITLSKGTEPGKVVWETEGHSPKGFKVVWSMNPSPEYPTREGDKYMYLGDPNANMAYLKGFAGEGTYYVRVCEYTGGACGIYNEEEVTIELGAAEVMPPKEKCADFDDVESYHTLCHHLQKAKNEGIVKPAQMFNPEEMITRAELATIIVNAFEIDLDISEVEPFADVDETNTHYESIMQLKALGVVRGESNMFKPDRPATRGQIIRMLRQTIEGLGLEDFSDFDKSQVKSVFKDAYIEHHTFADDISKMHYGSKNLPEGVIKGYPDGTFKPDANVNRIHATTFVMRATEFK